MTKPVACRTSMSACDKFMLPRVVCFFHFVSVSFVPVWFVFFFLLGYFLPVLASTRSEISEDPPRASPRPDPPQRVNSSALVLVQDLDPRVGSGVSGLEKV